ncbi:PREDICTED: putative mediator of RNA polymerase II transcription subunit 12 isoform X1 [Polistes canadensis]|uniref:putative mediator of RNA polymerase II transcription subunit 12 isoform X1 n=1 Tax=Polistes canadensis TaxID=91411 RepID=UPI000718FA86|nr:PREDICTED: putative mediator of RNA polymerase II transcription subunit 12 isoform X1 [Polistes canadensis]
MRIFLLVLATCLLALTESARPSIRPRVREPQVYYEEDNQAAEDDFETVYQPRTRALPSARSKEALQPSKAPPVQTIRNYNKVNDDGSFTFGYEAADGSFKEETRGTDCVVRGKYGYVDPDGNKREFTYVSGNPCDPNAPKEEDDDLPDKQEDDDLSGPANYPSVRPVAIRPIRPNYQSSTTRAPTTLFQTQYQLDDEASQELEEEVQKPVQLRPTSFRKPQQSYVQVSPSTALYEPTPTSPPQYYRLASTSNVQYQTTAAPSERTPSTVSPLAYQSLETSTRKPVTRHQVRPQSVAITPRPHIAQVAAQYVSPSSTERSIPYSTQSRPNPSTSNHLRTSTGPSSSAHLDFAAELERYVNTVGVPSKSAQQAALAPSRAKLGQTTVTTVPAEPIYQSELIYDPATGQYNTQLYQTLPQTVGDFSISHKLQPFVAQPHQSLLGLQQLQQIQQHQQQPQQQQQPQRQSAIYKHLPQAVQSASISAVSVAQPQELLYRKQQTQLLMQSQNLYAQQQRRQQQQQQQQQQQSQQQHQQQPQRLQLLESQRDPQAFYYVAPSRSSGVAASAPLTASQIDQYLRSASSANNY